MSEFTLFGDFRHPGMEISSNLKSGNFFSMTTDMSKMQQNVKSINFGLILATIHAEFHQMKKITILCGFCDPGMGKCHQI